MIKITEIKLEKLGNLILKTEVKQKYKDMPKLSSDVSHAYALFKLIDIFAVVFMLKAFVNILLIYLGDSSLILDILALITGSIYFLYSNYYKYLFEKSEEIHLRIRDIFNPIKNIKLFKTVVKSNLNRILKGIFKIKYDINNYNYELLNDACKYHLLMNEFYKEEISLSYYKKFKNEAVFDSYTDKKDMKMFSYKQTIFNFYLLAKNKKNIEALEIILSILKEDDYLIGYNDYKEPCDKLFQMLFEPKINEKSLEFEHKIKILNELIKDL